MKDCLEIKVEQRGWGGGLAFIIMNGTDNNINVRKSMYTQHNILYHRQKESGSLALLVVLIILVLDLSDFFQFKH